MGYQNVSFPPAHRLGRRRHPPGVAALGVGAGARASKLRQQERLREQLREALESRVVIEQAKGMTAHQCAVTVDQAYQRIRNHARNNNASLRTVAEAIVSVGLKV